MDPLEISDLGAKSIIAIPALYSGAEVSVRVGAKVTPGFSVSILAFP